MADKISHAVEKLLQFGSHTRPENPVSRKDLAPVFSAVANALADIEKRLKIVEGK